MLSNLKESSAESVNAQSHNKNISEMSKASNKLQDEYLTPSSGENKVRRMRMLVGAIFVAGLLVLVLMIKGSNTENMKISDENAAKIDMAIAQLSCLSDKHQNEISTIINKFYKYSDFEQIHVNQLRKNPFKIVAAAQSYADMNQNESAGEAVNTNLATNMKPEQMFKLQSIMKIDDVYHCMINDKIYVADDTVAGYAIKAIDAGSVTMINNGNNVVLTIDVK